MRANLGVALSLLLAWAATSSIGCSKSESSSSGDSTAPAAVTDLGFGTVTSRNVTLTWTAPGDDGTVGIAASYEIRYSHTNITSGNWGSAHAVSGEPAPQSPGTPQQFTVTQLIPETQYYFGLVTKDEAGNTSPLSNVPTTTTARQYRRLDVSPYGIYPYTTITDAIAAVAENDTILVHTGVYNEALSVQGKRFVLLGVDPDSAIVQYDATQVSAPVVSVGGGAHLEIRRMRFVEPYIPCGPGFMIDGATVILEDCALARCGLGASNAELTLRRCTLSRMPAMICDSIYPLLSLSGGTAVLEQNILAWAPHGVECSNDAQVTFACNDVYVVPEPDYAYIGCPDPTGTNGNIQQDPRLWAFTDDNFHLREDSPCRDGATPGCGRMGAYD